MKQHEEGHEQGAGNGPKLPIPDDFVEIENSLCTLVHEPLGQVTGSRFVALYPTSSASVVVHNGYGVSPLAHQHGAIYQAVSAVVVRDSQVKSWLVMDRIRHLCWTARPSAALRFLIDANVNDTGGK